MQTQFTSEQLATPKIATANDIFRACVHCGFCIATCPTYVTLGDERDSPRGRIYLIKTMLEQQSEPEPAVVTHVDRCLSCLSCMTTCPSGVHYMHLVDLARSHIEETHTRPLTERLLRRLLSWVLPVPGRFRLALRGAALVRPMAARLPGRLGAMVAMAPRRLPRRGAMDRQRSFAAHGQRRRRVALLAGCAQRVLNPAINEATIRLLTRLGCDVEVAAGSGCCGALTHHLGREADAVAAVKANILAWEQAERDDGLDAIVINASGCGTMVKDYGHMLKDDPEWAARGAAISAKAVDVSELLADIGLVGTAPEPLTVAYHSACSLQHGQRITELPARLLRDAGFAVKAVPEGHLCCGSAGTYNLMQPALAAKLLDRKIANIESVGADVVALGNIGCQVQIAGATTLPVLHTAELLDWATGGPKPAGLEAAPAAPSRRI